MKKRILIFSLVYYPRYIGGAEVAMKEITDRVPSEEFEFDMITMRKHARAFERVGNINVYRVGGRWFGTGTQSSKIFPLSKYLYIFLAFGKALKLHSRNHYDLVWSLMANYAGFSALFFKMTHPKVPFLLTLQEGDPIEHIRKRVGIWNPLFKKIFARADHIQAISTFLKEWAWQEGAKCDVDVVPNGVDLQKFEIRNSKFEKNEEIRKKLGIKKSDVVLITASRLVEKNGVGDIIESMRYLGEDVKLLIAGAGPLEKNLTLHVTRYTLQNRVFFLGFVPHSDLPDFLHAGDIFVRPSLSEGMGNSFIEAMAAGLPVIATPVGGIPDFLSAGETGLFCNVNDPKSIAEKVTYLIEHPGARDLMAKNARKMVEEKYDWNFIAEKVKKIFETMTAT